LCDRRPRAAIASERLCRKASRQEQRGEGESSVSSAGLRSDFFESVFFAVRPSQFRRRLLMRPLTFSKLFFQCLVLAVILFFVVIAALKFGAVPVSLYALGRDLLRVLLGQSSQISSDYGLIIQNIRFPRIILAIIVGASLSVAGTSFQALLRNPLADPYVLGVSYGAGVAAILGLLAEPHLALPPTFAALLAPLCAFLGTTATITAVYFLGRRAGQIDS